MAPNDGEPDGRLAARAVRGDRRAFAALVERHGPFLAQTARGFGLPETDIDDVVQDSFLAAWRGLARYDPERAFRTWLFKIAINKMRDTRRHRRVRSFLFGAIGYEETDESELVDAEPGPDREAGARLDLARVRSVLEQLDSVSREVMTLHALVGLSQAETAEALGLSVKAVEGRIARSRQKLTALLGPSSK